MYLLQTQDFLEQQILAFLEAGALPHHQTGPKNH